MRHTFVVLVPALLALSLPAPARALPVYPGALGHGTTTAAGRGGTVYRVTNLNNSGAGSFRAAVEASGARIVIFEVSGYIPLQSRIIIDDPYLTIAGQTAPPPGITIRDRDIRVSTHDVLIQHIRFRIGAADPFPTDGHDGLQIVAIPSTDIYNVVLDHCSISWALDESLDIGRDAHDLTISNCLFAQALRRSTMSTGKACYGPLLFGRSMTFYRNVFAHTGDRNPKFCDETSGVFVNNVVYNMTNSTDIQPTNPDETDPILLSIEGNVYKVGQTMNNFTTHGLIVQYQGVEANWNEGSQIWVDDNRCLNCNSGGDWDDAVVFTGSPPSQFIDDLEADARVSWPTGLTPIAASSVMGSVLPAVGAFPDDRDSLDETIVDHVADSLGTLVDCVISGEVVLDTGNVTSAPTNTTLVATGAAGTFTSNYVTYSIRVTNGGTPQVRTVTAFDPSSPGGGSKTFTVNTAWNPVPDNTYTWEVFESCNANGGGWPTLANLERGLVTPTDPNGDADSDGYTNIEEWIHTFPRDDAPVVSNFDAYVDSSSGGSDYFKYQYKLRAKWSTNLSTKSRVQYRVSGNQTWSQTTESASAATSHIRVVSGLNYNTTYDVRAAAIDNATGLVTYGAIETVTTYPASGAIWNVSISQGVVPGVGATATFSYGVFPNSSCKINVRKEQTPALAWGADEFTDATVHANHSHDVTALSLNTVYHAYIQAFPNSGFGGEDTVFPDGSVPGSTATTVYIRFMTPNKYGQGGWFEEQVSDPPPVELPTETYLSGNFPNPFNPSTTIEFGIPGERSPVTIAVYDIRGRLVRNLVDDVRSAGKHRVAWDGRDEHGSSVASGIYFLRMNVAGENHVRKMTLLK